MNHDIWHYTDGENSIGPLTEARLRAFHSANLVTNDTLVCRGEDAGWIRFADAFELTEAITGNRNTAEPPRSEITRRRASRLLTTAIMLAVVGTISLILPLNWAPVWVWIASPIFLGGAIIVGHLAAARSHAYFLGLNGRKEGYLCAGLLYFLLCICSCAVLLIVLTFGDARPVYLRDGWRGIDVSEPAAFSWAILRADVKVNVPSDPVLQPSEQQAAEKLARGIAAKNKLWLIVRMKLERASTAHQLAAILGEATNGFTLLSEWPDFNVGDSDTDERLFVALVRMTQASNAETARETQVCTAALATDIQRFGSDPEVQQAMPRFLAALNPPNALSGLAAALHNLATSLLIPSDNEHIEAARKSVEAEISNLNSSVELNPQLTALLQTALDRTVDLGPSETHVNGPWGTEVTVRGEQSSAAQSVATATASAVNLLSSYPAFVLTKRRSHPTPVTNALANEPSTTGTYLDRASLNKYFGTDGFLPRLGDDLAEVARRAATTIVRCSDHNYVTAASSKAFFDNSCTFTAVGRDRTVEGIIVYAPEVIDQHEHDLTPLADQIRAALFPAIFRHAASTNLLEVWASTDQTLVVCVRKFPTFETGGQTYYGSSNVMFGNADAAQLITDKQYFTRAPKPSAKDPIAFTDSEPKSTPKAAVGEKAVDPQPGPSEAHATPTPVRRLAKAGTFFLLRYVSVKTARGMYGFEPGHQVHLVRTVAGKSTLVVSDGKCELEVEPSLLTNDIDVAAAVGRADVTMQEQIATQTDRARTATEGQQHQLDVDHARDIEEIEKRRVQDSRLGATPNPLDQ